MAGRVWCVHMRVQPACEPTSGLLSLDAAPTVVPPSSAVTPAHPDPLRTSHTPVSACRTVRGEAAGHQAHLSCGLGIVPKVGQVYKRDLGTAGCCC